MHLIAPGRDAAHARAQADLDGLRQGALLADGGEIDGQTRRHAASVPLMGDRDDQSGMAAEAKPGRARLRVEIAPSSMISRAWPSPSGR